MYVYVYIYIYIHVYIYTYIYIHPHIYVTYISSAQLKAVKQLKRLSSILFLPPIFDMINMSSSVKVSDNLVKKFS